MLTQHVHKLHHKPRRPFVGSLIVQLEARSDLKFHSQATVYFYLTIGPRLVLQNDSSRWRWNEIIGENVDELDPFVLLQSPASPLIDAAHYSPVLPDDEFCSP